MPSKLELKDIPAEATKAAYLKLFTTDRYLPKPTDVKLGPVASDKVPSPVEQLKLLTGTGAAKLTFVIKTGENTPAPIPVPAPAPVEDKEKKEGEEAPAAPAKPAKVEAPKPEPVLELQTVDIVLLADEAA